MAEPESDFPTAGDLYEAAGIAFTEANDLDTGWKHPQEGRAEDETLSQELLRIMGRDIAAAAVKLEEGSSFAELGIPKCCLTWAAKRTPNGAFVKNVDGWEQRFDHAAEAAFDLLAQSA